MPQVGGPMLQVGDPCYGLGIHATVGDPSTGWGPMLQVGDPCHRSAIHATGWGSMPILIIELPVRITMVAWVPRPVQRNCGWPFCTGVPRPMLQLIRLLAGWKQLEAPPTLIQQTPRSLMGNRLASVLWVDKPTSLRYDDGSKNELSGTRRESRD